MRAIDGFDETPINDNLAGLLGFSILWITLFIPGRMHAANNSVILEQRSVTERTLVHTTLQQLKNTTGS